MVPNAPRRTAPEPAPTGTRARHRARLSALRMMTSPWNGHEAPVTARVASGLAFVAGVWLAVAPIALGYAPAGGGFEGYGHDLLVGGVIAITAFIRVIAPKHLPVLSLLHIAFGTWLILAPAVLGYEGWPGSATATIVSVVVGGVVVTAAAVSAGLTYRRPQQHI